MYQRDRDDDSESICGVPRETGPKVDAPRLWAGGTAAALVAAGVAIVGLLIARGVFHTRVLVPESDAALINDKSWRYAVLAAVATLDGRPGPDGVRQPRDRHRRDDHDPQRGQT